MVKREALFRDNSERTREANGETNLKVIYKSFVVKLRLSRLEGAGNLTRALRNKEKKEKAA